MAKARKIELPADLAVAYVPPEDAQVTEVDAMIAQAAADAKKALDSKDGSTAERLDKANYYMGAIDALKTRKAEITTAADAEKAAEDEARARLAATLPSDEDPAEEDAGDTADGDEEDEGGEVAPVVESGTATEQGAGMEPALVASGAPGRRSAVAAAARGAGRPAAPVVTRSTRPEAFLTASTNTGEIGVGSTIDWDAFGSVADSQFSALPKVKGSARSVNRIGNVQLPSFDPELVASQKVGSDIYDGQKAMDWAVSSKRLQKETGEKQLTASAGWCAPSETLYDLLDFTTEDGLLDLPGITVNRGGVRFTLGPNFSAIWGTGGAGAGIGSQTEAQNIANTPKPVVNIPCPSFTDHRLGVDFIYLTGDILAAKGYPEAYADFTQKALKAFAHYQNLKRIADMVTASTPATIIETFFGATSDLLGAIELQITDMRYRNRMSLTQAVEIVLPVWAKGVLRADIAKRQGYEDAMRVTDADIVDWISIRGGAVQFVYDWQDAYSGVAGGFGAATPILAWPTAVTFLAYPQGTFVSADSDVIELSAVYDSTLLTTNQYVALFMERARMTLLRGWDARTVTVPFRASGVTAGAIATAAGPAVAPWV